MGPELSNFVSNISNSVEPLNILNLLGNFVIAVALSLILRIFYIKYGTTNSNRTAIANIFPLLIVCTMLIIYMIKTSIALSLGLVGALSIVRFRAAIKEPEELIYLFFAIAVGLGLGADQIVPTTMIFFLVMPLIYLLKKHYNKSSMPRNYFMNISLAKEDQKIEEEVLQTWTNIISCHAPESHIHRFDESIKQLNATFIVTKGSLESLSEIKKELLASSPETCVTFIDNTNPLVVN